MSGLKPFDPEAACGTCRSDNVSYTYDPGNDEYEELILRQCNRCNGLWHEVPLDLWNQRKYHDAVERDL